MTKRSLLLVTVVLSIGLTFMNAQPFAYITAMPIISNGPSIVVLNLSNYKVASYFSGADVYGAYDIAVSSDGSRAVATTESSLLIIDTAAQKITARVRLGNLGNLEDTERAVISPDGQYAYVTGSKSGTIWSVNLNDKRVVAIPVGGKPTDMAVTPDGSRVYVAGCEAFGRSICIISPDTNAVTDKLNIDSKRLIVSPDGTRVYSMGLSGFPVTVLDAVTNVKIATISLSTSVGENMAITPDGKFLYVTTWLSAGVVVINTSTNKIVATANIGAPGAIAISPDGKRAFVITSDLWVINTETNTVADKISPPSSLNVSRFKRIAITPGPMQKPAFSSAGVVNAASFQGGGTIAPGEIVTLFGSAIGPPALATMRLTPAGLVDNSLADTRVLFDGVPAPLIYVSQGQNSVIVPYVVAGKSTAQAQVEYKGLKSEPVALRVVSAAPGIFTLNSSGKGQGAVLNENATVNSVSNPALRGSIVVLFATGEGQTDPPGFDGKVANEVFPKPLLPVSAQIGGVSAEVLYAGAAPGMVAGVLQVNVRVPPTVSPGNAVPVILAVGNTTSQQGVTLAIR